MENNQTKKQNLTKKLVITLSSMLLCLMLISVSVYAAISQSVTLNNSIIVNTNGQAKAIVTVYEQVVAGDKAVETPTEPAEWGEAVFEKAETKDNDSFDGLTPVVFSQTDGKNMYAYKITVQNKSSVAVAVGITSSTESNTEIDVYYGEDFDNLTKVENGQAVSFTKNGLEVNGQVTCYIVVCANTDLVNMTAATSQPFDIEVVVNA